MIAKLKILLHKAPRTIYRQKPGHISLLTTMRTEVLSDTVSREINKASHLSVKPLILQDLPNSSELGQKGSSRLLDQSHLLVVFRDVSSAQEHTYLERTVSSTKFALTAICVVAPFVTLFSTTGMLTHWPQNCSSPGSQTVANKNVSSVPDERVRSFIFIVHLEKGRCDAVAARNGTFDCIFGNANYRYCPGMLTVADCFTHGKRCKAKAPAMLTDQAQIQHTDNFIFC